MEGFGFGYIDWFEVIRRIFRYVILGLVVAFAATYLMQGKMSNENLLVLALTVASVYALLDLVSPSMGGAARLGSGVGLGIGLVGGL